MFGLYGLLTTPLKIKTFFWSVVMYIFSSLGKSLVFCMISTELNQFKPSRNYGRCALVLQLVRRVDDHEFSGYHRLWSHRSYNASIPLQAFLLIAGASAVQGSAYWWARGHRVHHRYTDSELDPYNAKRGILWSHIGWMMVKPERKLGMADISDLRKDPLIQWQHQYYFLLVVIFGYALPSLIAGYFWNDYSGGFYYASLLRMTIVHHVTVSIFSVVFRIRD